MANLLWCATGLPIAKCSTFNCEGRPGLFQYSAQQTYNPQEFQRPEAQANERLCLSCLPLQQGRYLLIAGLKHYWSNLIYKVLDILFLKCSNAKYFGRAFPIDGNYVMTSYSTSLGTPLQAKAVKDLLMLLF